MSCTVKGELVFNAHRIYGYERLAYISENFELVGFLSDECIGSFTKYAKHDPILILRKPETQFNTTILVSADFERAVHNTFW